MRDEIRMHARVEGRRERWNRTKGKGFPPEFKT